MALTLLAKLVGLWRDVVVAAHFGTSQAMDAFVVATTIAGLMMAWLKTPIQVVVLPIFTRDVARRGEAAAWKSASVLLNGSSLLFLVAAGVGVLLAPYLVMVMAPGLGEETAGLATLLARILMTTLIFHGVAQFLAVLSQAYQRFGRPGLAGTVDNLVIIGAVLLLTAELGVFGLALGAILGTIAQVGTQFSILWTHRRHWRFRVNLQDPSLQRMLRIGLPLMIGTGGASLGTISDRIFASLLPAGRLSALAYAHQLTFASIHLFAASLTTVLFPVLSRKAGLADYEALGQKLTKALVLLLAIVVPISFGFAVLHEPLVRLVYHRGAFTEESVRLTAQPVLFFAIGLSAYTVSHVLSYAFYSVQNTRTPVIGGFARFGAKLLFSLAFIRPLSHGGLALAESLSFFVKTALLVALLPRELRRIDYARILRSFGLTTAISTVMALVVLWALPIVESAFEVGPSFAATLATLAASVAAGAATYLLLALLVHPVEVKEVYRLVRAGMFDTKP